MKKQMKVSLGSVFAQQLGVVRARLDMSTGRDKIEKLAKELQADLADPVQYRAVTELAQQR